MLTLEQHFSSLHMHGEPDGFGAGFRDSMTHMTPNRHRVAYVHREQLAVGKFQDRRAAQHDDPFVIRLIVPVIFRAAVRM